MSRIPDCRTDEAYNEKYLNKLDREFVRGYDYAVEELKTLFDNIEIYEQQLDDVESTDVNIFRMIKRHDDLREAVRESFEDWMEMQRDEMITSLIESMDEDEYEKNRSSVEAQSKAQ